MILGIETSTEVCSVALGNGGRCIAEKRIEGRGVHSEYTFTFLKELTDRYKIKPVDFEAVLFSNGPGSYTGLRIGAGAIKGFLFGRDVPFYTLPTLVSFSVPFLDDGSKEIHAVIDARREHLYHQKISVKNEGRVIVEQPSVKEVSEIAGMINSGAWVIGTGWERFRIEESQNLHTYGREAISAKSLVNGWYHSEIKKLFKATNPERFEPNYLTIAQVNNSEIK